ncbi:MAG: glycosyltransferase family 39 protein [Candidatus Lernaella stagnicola]|nr:glycosyltransferase family 39 protein [Candidatus Lernaella stagnicola]
MRDRISKAGNNTRVAWLAATTILLLAALNAGWVLAHVPAMIGVDSWDFYPASIHYYRYLQGVEDVGFDPVAAVGSYRGPLFHWASMPLPLLFGGGLWAFAITNIFFTIGLLALVWFAGRRLHGDWAGWLALLMLGTTPVIVHGARSYNLEIPLATLVTLSVVCLLAADRLQKTWWALGFGLAAGAAMLVKGVAFLYFLPPLLGAWIELFAARRWPRPGETRPSWIKALATTALALAAAAGVSLLWYRDHFTHLSETIFHQIGNYWEIYEPLRTEGGASVWQQILVEAAPLVLLLGAIGMIGLTRRRRPGWGVLLAWGIVPALGFLSGPADFARFLSAAFPAFALAGGIALARLPWEAKRTKVLLAAVVLSCAFYAAASLLPVRDNRAPLSVTPSQYFDWPDREIILETIGKETRDIAAPTIAVYAAGNLTTVPPKVYYSYLALAFPRARIYAAVHDDNFGYRFREFCGHLPAADALIVVEQRPDAAGVEHPGMAPPPLASTGQAALAACLAQMERVQNDYRPALRLLPRAPQHAGGVRVYIKASAGDAPG